MKIPALQCSNQPAFQALYTTKGSHDKNREFYNKLVGECELMNETWSPSASKKYNDKALRDSVYNFEIIQLTPNYADSSIQLVATNEHALPLKKFVNRDNNKIKFNFDLYSGEKVSYIDIKAKQFFEKGEIDNFLDCLIEKKKQLATLDPMLTAQNIIKKFRKGLTTNIKRIPIFEIENVLEACRENGFDFAKGTMKIFK